MSKIKKLLGLRIRELRKSRNITQEQLAEMLGIGTANISYIENGKFAPSIENFEKLVEIFNIEPYELYKFSNFKSDEEMLNEIVRSLSSDTDLLKLVYKFYLTVK